MSTCYNSQRCHRKWTPCGDWFLFLQLYFATIFACIHHVIYSHQIVNPELHNPPQPQDVELGQKDPKYLHLLKSLANWTLLGFLVSGRPISPKLIVGFTLADWTGERRWSQSNSIERMAPSLLYNGWSQTLAVRPSNSPDFPQFPEWANLCGRTLPIRYLPSAKALQKPHTVKENTLVIFSFKLVALIKQ